MYGRLCQVAANDRGCCSGSTYRQQLGMQTRLTKHFAILKQLNALKQPPFHLLVTAA
jgi:hypothetical protein